MKNTGFGYVKGIYLGNVLQVVTDRKLQIEDDVIPGDVAYYIADVVSQSDYFPFGMLMPNTSDEADEMDYRYSFQGQEKDNEIKGDNNSINYKYRMHDPRVGRFFAVDPLASKYPFWSPYGFSGNQVVHTVELEGLESAYNLNTVEGTITTDGCIITAEQYDRIVKNKFGIFLQTSGGKGNDPLLGIELLVEQEISGPSGGLKYSPVFLIPNSKTVGHVDNGNLMENGWSDFVDGAWVVKLFNEETLEKFGEGKDKEISKMRATAKNVIDGAKIDFGSQYKFDPENDVGYINVRVKSGSSEKLVNELVNGIKEDNGDIKINVVYEDKIMSDSGGNEVTIKIEAVSEAPSITITP